MKKENNIEKEQTPNRSRQYNDGGDIYLFSKSGYSIADNIFLVDFATMRMMGREVNHKVQRSRNLSDSRRASGCKFGQNMRKGGSGCFGQNKRQLH